MQCDVPWLAEAEVSSIIHERDARGSAGGVSFKPIAQAQDSAMYLNALISSF